MIYKHEKNSPYFNYMSYSQLIIVLNANACHGIMGVLSLIFYFSSLHPIPFIS